MISFFATAKFQKTKKFSKIVNIKGETQHQQIKKVDRIERKELLANKEKEQN